jgi:two-component system sensor histidine kinase CreC
MKIGLRIFLGYFLIVGLAGFFVMRVFVNEVKPGVRQSMEDTLIDTANVLAQLATQDLRDGEIGSGEFAKSVDRLTRPQAEAPIWGYRKDRFDYRIYVTDTRGIVVYDSAKKAVGQDYSRWNDVYLTLRGRYGARSTRSDPNDDSSSVMHVATPIFDGQRLIGVLTVAKANSRIQPFIEGSQREILKQGALLLGLSFLIGLAVTLWLSRGLGRLGRYAKAVTAGERVAVPDLGGGELGELGQALETMRAKLDGKQYVEQYVQTLAHEMKSPLAAIRGAAEILEGNPSEVDRARFVDNIGSQSLRMSGMIDKMLALAAVEYRQSLEKREPVDLSAMVDEVRRSAEPRFSGKSLRLRMELPEQPIIVAGDRFLLAQAVNNLLDNAIEFSPAGGEIVIGVSRNGGDACLSVRDAGPGVPEFARDRVFERFYSLPRPDGGRSSGLGLSFVREVAALHGGRVSLDNQDGGGAVAQLRLPA